MLPVEGFRRQLFGLAILFLPLQVSGGPISVLEEDLPPDFVLHDIQESNAQMMDSLATATYGDGNFVVIWAERSHYANFSSDIYLRRYDKEGTPLDSDRRRVNDLREIDVRHRTPAVAADEDGLVAILWVEQHEDHVNHDCQGHLRMRALEADGSFPYPSWNLLDGVEGTHDSPGGARDFTSRTCRPDITTDGNGRFVTAWEDHSDESLHRIYTRLLDREELELEGDEQWEERPESLGSALIQVNALENDFPRTRAKLAVGQDGEHAVAWLSPEGISEQFPDQDLFRVWIRRFDFQGSPLDNQEFRADGGELPADALGMQTGARVSLNETGDFAAVWHQVEENDDEDSFFHFSIQGWTFDSDGTADQSFGTPKTGSDVYATPSVLLHGQEVVFGWTEQIGNEEFHVMTEAPFVGNGAVQLNEQTINASDSTQMHGPALGYADPDTLVAVWMARDGDERISAMSSNFVPPPEYTVSFELGTEGQWAGGGELSQVVVEGEAAEAPEVEVIDDDLIFDGWDRSFDEVMQDMTVVAQYKSKHEEDGDDDGSGGNGDEDDGDGSGGDDDGGSGGGGSSSSSDTGPSAIFGTSPLLLVVISLLLGLRRRVL